MYTVTYLFYLLSFDPPYHILFIPSSNNVIVHILSFHNGKENPKQYRKDFKQSPVPMTFQSPIF